MIREFCVEIETCFICLFAILKILKGLNSWVYNIKPNWWDSTHHERVEVLEGVIWGVVKSTQDLIGSESVSVVIGVSLDSEQNWGAQGIP